MNVLALCSGIGGIEVGLKLAEPTARTVCYVEREAFPIAATLARIQEGYLDDAPIWSDATTFDGKPWRGVVDCITGGYPCQPFSNAGSRKGEDDPRHLWPDIRRIIKEVQPRFCFFENVANHLRIGFESVWRDLCDMGYQVEAGIFTASEVGAPHKRERLFIYAHTRQQWPQVSTEGEFTAVKEFGSSRPTRTNRRTPHWPPSPELCGVANGIPHRVDRIAALGNAVVPAVAAKAWQELRKAK
jgi:site-specific DNA-cytosine methylase